jgi:hypothetical protein
LPSVARADIDLPAGEARGEADVLPAAADRERLLIFRDLHDRAIFFFEEFDA